MSGSTMIKERIKDWYYNNISDLDGCLQEGQVHLEAKFYDKILSYYGLPNEESAIITLHVSNKGLVELGMDKIFELSSKVEKSLLEHGLEYGGIKR